MRGIHCLFFVCLIGALIENVHGAAPSLCGQNQECCSGSKEMGEAIKVLVGEMQSMANQRQALGEKMLAGSEAAKNEAELRKLNEALMKEKKAHDEAKKAETNFVKEVKKDQEVQAKAVNEGNAKIQNLKEKLAVQQEHITVLHEEEEEIDDEINEDEAELEDADHDFEVAEEDESYDAKTYQFLNRDRSDEKGHNKEHQKERQKPNPVKREKRRGERQASCRMESEQGGQGEQGGHNEQGEQGPDNALEEAPSALLDASTDNESVRNSQFLRRDKEECRNPRRDVNKKLKEKRRERRKAKRQADKKAKKQGEQESEEATQSALLDASKRTRSDPAMGAEDYIRFRAANRLMHNHKATPKRLRNGISMESALIF